MAMPKTFDAVIDTILPSYKANFTLRPFQREVLEYVFNTDGNAIVSALTGAGKSAIFHLIGRVLCAKRSNRSTTPVLKCVTVVLAPLNIIQSDQIKSLKKLGISACKLDIGGNAAGYQEESRWLWSESPGSDKESESEDWDEDADCVTSCDEDEDSDFVYEKVMYLS